MRFGFFGGLILLLIVLSLAITGIIVITQATRTGDDCLLIRRILPQGDISENNFFEAASLWDVYSNVGHTRSTVPPVEPPAEEFDPFKSYWQSPDGTQLAYFGGDLGDLAGWEGPVIESYHHPFIVRQSMHGKHDNGDIIWSPDGRWIAATFYNTQTDEISLKLADVNGDIQQRRVVPPTGYGFFSVNWSADSRYLMLVTAHENGGEVTFWSVPDLQQINTGVDSQGIDMNCNTCTLGSSQGHRTVYTFTDSTKQSHLVMLTPGEAGVKTFDLPSANVHDVRLSPNSDYAAVASLADNTDDSRSRLDIFGMNGIMRRDIGLVEDGFCTACKNGVEMEWSFDSKTLVYVEANAGNSLSTNVSAYRLDTGNIMTLATVPSGTWSDLFISPTQPTAILDNSTQGLFLLSLDGQPPKSLGEPVVNPGIQWSPDGSRFTIFSSNTNVPDAVFSSDGVFLHSFAFSPADSVYPGLNSFTWTDCR